MPSINETLNLLRADDLLVLDFEFVNLRLELVTTGTRKLVRTQTGQPALIIVTFPPQHIGEEAFVEDASGNLTSVRELSKSILSGPSRLVFKVPDEMAEVPFTLTELLNWSQYELSVAPNALPRDAATDAEPTEPTPEQTAIELPYRLLISPDSSAGWAHAVEPVTHAGRTELWHTRLAVRQRAPGTAIFTINETAEPTVRAIWSPDIDGGGAEPFIMSLNAEQRTEIVQLSSDFSLLDPANFRLGPDEHPEELPSYQPAPLEVERLLLSALGGWLSLASKWNFPDLGPFLNKLRGHELDPEGTVLFQLAEWRHIATMGRDQYVRTVERGVLCPHGHRASLVTITERKFKSLPTAPREMIAYLAQRKFIVVQEAEKDYRVLSKAYAHQGFEMPLKRLRIMTLVTPNLSNVPPDPTHHFRPEVDGEVFRFHIVGEDWSGEPVNFAAPLIFVPLKDNDINAIKIDYEADARNTDIDMQGQNIAFADSPGKPGAATLKTTQLLFRMQVKNGGLQTGLLPVGHPHFLPFVEQADVNIPAIDQLLGSAVGPAGGAKTIRIKFHDTYLNNDSNPGEVFAALVSKSSVNVPEKLPLNVPADKAGGLATPNMPIEGLSRSLGPVADPDNIAGGKFDPANFFGGDGDGGLLSAKLLGGVSLASIIEKTSDVQSFGDQVPKLTTKRLPDAVETRLDWIPRLRNEPSSPLILNEPGKPASTLEIISTTRTPFNGAGSTFNVSGVLTNFAINFLDVLTVTFEKLTFVAEKGKKIDVSAAGVDVLFTGPLSFVNELRNILPPSGFSDGPSITVTPEGVTVGYSLGIPNVGIGIFSLENIALSSRLSLPFVDKPAGVRFAVSERQHPFLVTVSLFAGGGFFALAVSTRGIEQIEASIEFGGNFSLNLGVASGGVHILAGIYFNMVGSDVKLTGYVRCGGEVEVLGLISISVEFYLGLTYDIGDQKVWGQATLHVSVKVAFFSASVSLTVERKFGGSSGDPTFEQMVAEADWQTYCAAFA